MGRLIRTQSTAALRVIDFIHISRVPRSGSNLAPFLHARSSAICTTSSAEPESPTIRRAIHDSRRRKRSTNFSAHSSSPAQKPFRRSVSGSRLCVTTSHPSRHDAAASTPERHQRPHLPHADEEGEAENVADLTVIVPRYVDSAVVDEWNPGRTRLGLGGSSRGSAASFPRADGCLSSPYCGVDNLSTSRDWLTLWSPNACFRRSSTFA